MSKVSKFPWRPIGSRILVKPEAAADVAQVGGIFVTAKTMENVPTEGVVVATGPGRILPDGSVKPLEVKPGMRVILSKFGGTEIKMPDGCTYKMVDEAELVAVENK